MYEGARAGRRAGDPRRSGFKWSVAAGLVVLTLSALFIATTQATTQVADAGIGLGQAEATLGANDLALKALGQAVLIAEDHAYGVADDTTLHLAVAEARATMDELAAELSRLSETTGPDVATSQLAAAVLDAGRLVLDLIESGQIDAAGQGLEARVGDFEALRDRVNAMRERKEVALTSTGATASRLRDVVTFLIAFVLPLGAVLAYRYAARRQLHTAEIQLDARLDAEREVMRAKDEFIGNISHELRTPLTTIFGFSELLLETGAVDPSTTVDVIALINQESSELTRMVEDLLVSARLEANALTYTYELVDVGEELAPVIGTRRADGPKVIVAISDGTCWADPVRVRQILRNLISNSERYGGPNVRVTSTRRDDMLELIVEDDGPGVPPEVVPRLFTRYVHAGRDAIMAGSVGLGLSVVGSLAQDMGGGAGYEYRDGWARFSVRLPSEPSTATTQGTIDPIEQESARQAAFLRSWLEAHRRQDLPVRSGHDL